MDTKCPRNAVNAKRCTCTYAGCTRHGTCCECLHHHLSAKQLPGCCFPAAAEAIFDRSFRKFIEVWQGRC